MNKKLCIAGGCGLAALMVSCAWGAAPLNYPNKPVRFIAANSAGGGLDIVARSLAPKLAAVFGYQVVVDNRAGAAGSIASEITAHAPKDGHTIMTGSLGGLAVNTNLYKGLNYHPLRDLAAITFATSSSNVLVVNPSVPAKTVQELIALARAEPGKLTYGSSGAGNAGHLAGELFKSMTKTEMVHVPYKGGAPATVDLLGGHVQAYFSGIPAQLPHIRAGRVRALAITTLKRSTTMPELPTFDEAGVPGYDANSWMGVFAPARAPKALVQRLHSQIEAVMKSPEMREAMTSQGIEPAALGPQEFAASIRADYEKYARLIKQAGIRLD